MQLPLAMWGTLGSGNRRVNFLVLSLALTGIDTERECSLFLVLLS